MRGRYRRQKTDVRGQMSDVRGQRTEDRGQKNDDRMNSFCQDLSRTRKLKGADEEK